MSFILDALKRAERERKLEKAPDLSAIYQDESPNRRKHRQWFWAGGAALVLLAAVVVIFWAKEPSAPAPRGLGPIKGTEGHKPVRTVAGDRKSRKEDPFAGTGTIRRKRTADNERRNPLFQKALTRISRKRSGESRFSREAR